MKDSRAPIYNHPLNKDTLLLRTFLFVPRLKFKFNPLNTDTQLINRTLSEDPLVSVLTSFEQLVEESTGYESRQTSKLKTTVL